MIHAGALSVFKLLLHSFSQIILTFNASVAIMNTDDAVVPFGDKEAIIESFYHVYNSLSIIILEIFVVRFVPHFFCTLLLLFPRFLYTIYV